MIPPPPLIPPLVGLFLKEILSQRYFANEINLNAVAGTALELPYYFHRKLKDCANLPINNL